MFKRLKNLFSKSSPVDELNRNRQRFDSIISDKRCNFLKRIYKRLFNNYTTLTDKEILDAYFKFKYFPLN
jgi:hypothetical protein